MVVEFVFALAVLAAGAAGCVAAMVAVGLKLTGCSVPVWLTRTALVGGLLLAGVGLVAVLAGLVSTWALTSAHGLTQLDKMRMLSNGYAETMYNALVGGLGVLAAVAGWLTR